MQENTFSFHASPDVTITLLKNAGILFVQLENACREVHAACDIFASSCRPYSKKKMSLTHVNEAFNLKIQAELSVVYIRHKVLKVLNIIDINTQYEE